MGHPRVLLRAKVGHPSEELDSESNLHHFTFRQLSTTQGRWMSPDPVGMAAADERDPQSLNRYAYVTNQPNNFKDIAGLFELCTRDLVCLDSFFEGLLGVPFNVGGLGEGGNWGAMGDFGGGDLINIPPPPLFQTLWSDLLGLPTALSCPQVGGASNFLCGGINPISDYADNPNNSKPCLPGAGPLAVGQSRCGLDLSPQAIKCTLAGIGTMVLDEAGFIPGEGVAHSLFGVGLGIVSTPVSAAHGDTTGAFAGILGIHLSALELTGSKAVPVVGTILNGSQFIRDWNNIPEDYSKCVSGGG